MDVHIVDNDQNTRLMYSEIAQTCGFSSASFSCPDDYLKSMVRLGYSSPSVAILCDLEMPGMNGYQFMKAVRAINPEQRFVIIANTPDIEDQKQTACLYFLKPVVKANLEAAFFNLAECVKCGRHPECKGQNACMTDDRNAFAVTDWKCHLDDLSA